MEPEAQEKQYVTQNFQAIYANGVFRPLEPVNLPENQQVTVTVTNGAAHAEDDFLDHEFMAYIESQADDSVTLEAVREALSTIPGSLSDDIRAQRDED